MNKITAQLEHNGIGFDWNAYQNGLLNDKLNAYNKIVVDLSAALHCSTSCVVDPLKIIWKLYDNHIYPKSLGLEYLKSQRNSHPIYEKLYRMKRLQQFLNQYGNKLHGQIQADGRIYAKWRLDGAKTGRMTCKEPNLQAFPGELQPYFKPQQGRCFVSCDYSQIELRVLAELAQDDNLIRSFQNGIDVHRSTASAIYGVPVEEVTEEQRAIAKKVNFGVCYGISAAGLQEMLRKKAGIEVDFQTANDLKSNFYEAYPRVKNYHNHLLTTTVIESLGGRQWVDYPKGIARVNLPVQASAAEGLKLALQLLVRSLPEDVLLVNVIHDEIILEAPCEQAEAISCLLSQCMIDGMGKLIQSVPIVVDINLKFF